MREYYKRTAYLWAQSEFLNFPLQTRDYFPLSTFHFPATLITQKILWTRTTALILKFIILKSIKMLYCRFSALVKYNSLNFHTSKISFQHYKNSYAIIPTFIGWTFLSCGMHSDICLYLKKKIQHPQDKIKWFSYSLHILSH